MSLNNEDYPVILNASHIAEILGISKRKAYEIMDYPGFPLFKIGRCKRVAKDSFYNWLKSREGANQGNYDNFR